MMTCAQVADVVRDHELGRLPGRARWSVRMHLLMCDGCRRYLRQLRAVAGLLQAQPEAPPPEPDAEAALLARFRARRDEPGA